MGNKTIKKHLFFDYDGVLVDSLLIAVKNDNALMKYCGKPIHVTSDMIRKKWGRGWQYRDDLLAARPDILIDKPDQLKDAVLKITKSV